MIAKHFVLFDLHSALLCVRIVVLVLSSLLDLLLRHCLEVLLHLLRLPELPGHHNWLSLSGDSL
jgi:hypothetical protein